MNKLYNLLHPNIVVIGLGNSGFATASFLAKEKIPFVVMDNRENPPMLSAFKDAFSKEAFSHDAFSKDAFSDSDFRVITGRFDVEILKNAGTLILSPGISINHPQIKPYLSPKTEIIGDIELLARTLMLKQKEKEKEKQKSTQKPIPLIAITGSNGKSTVTSLVGEMAKKNYHCVGIGGNLGTPALDLVSTSIDCLVLELSSFQLETTYSLKPLVSTVLNICFDHMDRYSSLEDYYAAKARIYSGAKHVVFNRDDAYILQHREASNLLRNTGGNTIGNTIGNTFGLNVPPDERAFGLRTKNDQLYLSQGTHCLMPVTDLKLFGRHNIANALAALTLGSEAGFSLDSMLSTLQTFTGLPHRCEWVRTLDNVLYINDSKGTNVGATLAAISGLADSISGKWVMIAGGLSKNADFSPLKALLAKHGRALVLMGSCADQLHALFQTTLPCHRVNSLEEAVHLSQSLAKPGDGVLLSPACASFDMFKDFEDRGNQFKAIVNGLNIC